VLENCSIFHQLYKNENIQSMLDEVLVLKSLKPDISLYMTGGGAFKYKTDIEKTTGLQVIQLGEMEAIYSGINFGKALKKKIVYSINHQYERIYNDNVPAAHQMLEYPFLAVNIGSGVSIILFSAPNGEFRRVGGTSLGGTLL